MADLTRSIGRHRVRQPALVAVLALVVVGAVAFLVLRPDGTTSDEAIDSLLRAGLAAHAEGDLDTATSKYEAILDRDPTNKYAHYNLGLLAQTQGRPGDAEQRYREALTTDPGYQPALFNLAVLRFEAGDHVAAIDLYRQLILLDADNAAAHLNLGLALRAAGFEDQAAVSIANALELDPSLSTRVPADHRGPDG